MIETMGPTQPGQDTKMKIYKMRSAFYEASDKASELSRQLAFAGIAVIWVLKVGNDSGGIPFSNELNTPLYYFVAALALDLMQYIYKTVAWGVLNHFNWKKYQNNDVDIKVSEKINWPTNLLFWSKVIAIGVGYVQLLLYIHSKL